MSGLFSKRLYMTPLQAIKPSSAFRFPTRSLTTSASVYQAMKPFPAFRFPTRNLSTPASVYQAMKPSPAFRFPTRSLSTSANVYSGIGPKKVHNDEAPGNAETGKQFTLHDNKHSVCYPTGSSQVVANEQFE